MIQFGRDARALALRKLLRHLGCTERHRAALIISSPRDGVAAIVNPEPRGGGVAKAYHVKQVRDIILRYRRYRSAEPCLGDAKRDDDAA